MGEVPPEALLPLDPSTARIERLGLTAARDALGDFAGVRRGVLAVGTTTGAVLESAGGARSMRFTRPPPTREVWACSRRCARRWWTRGSSLARSATSTHGTATEANDRVEALALRALFEAEQPWVSSTKGLTGHTLGAAGALETALCLSVLESGRAPPTMPPAPAEALDDHLRFGLNASGGLLCTVAAPSRLDQRRGRGRAVVHSLALGGGQAGHGG